MGGTDDQTVGAGQPGQHARVLDLEGRGDRGAGPVPREGGAQVVFPAVVGGDAAAQHRLAAARRRVVQPQHPGDGGTQEDQAAHEGGHGVSRQAEHRRFAQAPEHERLAGPHGDAPEVDVESRVAENGPHEVVVADGGAADGHEHVRAPRSGGEGPERLLGVEGDAEVDGLGAGLLHEGAEADVVGAHDLVGSQRLARHDEFVARRQDGDARLAAHAQPRTVHRRRQRDVPGAQNASGPRAGVAFAEVEAGGPDVRSPRRPRLDDDPRAVGVRVFLDDDRVGAARHRAAGEDPDRLARADDAVVGAPRRRLPDPAQRGRRPGDVVRAHRVAVHRRDGDRRLGDARAHLRRQDPAQGVRQPHGLDARGRERIEDPSPRLGDGNHRRLTPPRRRRTCRRS